MAEKLRIYVIGSEDTVIGFGLIGLSGQVVYTVKETQTLLSEVARKKEYKIIIINSRLV